MYEHAIKYFLCALKGESIGNICKYLLDEVHGDEAIASLCGQCDRYIVRADRLKEYIKKKEKDSIRNG